jgi:hypothetical protein
MFNNEKCTFGKYFSIIIKHGDCFAIGLESVRTNKFQMFLSEGKKFWAEVNLQSIFGKKLKN